MKEGWITRVELLQHPGPQAEVIRRLIAENGLDPDKYTLEPHPDLRLCCYRIVRMQEHAIAC